MWIYLFLSCVKHADLYMKQFCDCSIMIYAKRMILIFFLKWNLDVWWMISKQCDVCSLSFVCLRYYTILFALPLFRFKSEEERIPLYQVVEESFPRLLNIFSKLVQIPNPPIEVADLIKLICKIFWSSIYVYSWSYSLVVLSIFFLITCCWSCYVLYAARNS